ncbi:MAG: COX15/CtaA family protein [Flavisolibacter sp.]
MDARQDKNLDKKIGIWLMIGVGMLIIQILLGGITRLTGSGLSITKWEIITGSLPPLGEMQWNRAFHLYQQTTQYRLLNSSFTLNEFKAIFFWEWFHRLWGRVIGLAFFLPFVFFLWKRAFTAATIKPMVILLLLGALQGAVGWVMVLSGLKGDALYVEPVKLALHFLLASILIGYTFWFGLNLWALPVQTEKPNSYKNYTRLLVAVILIQLVFGALMAGNKAARAAPTWPDINGSIIPTYIFTPPEGWRAVVENPLVIHFIHRSMAYLIFIGLGVWTILALRVKGSRGFQVIKLLPALLVSLQLILGIFTVLTSTKIRVAEWNIFEWMAEMHQLIGICLLLAMLGCVYFLQTQKKPYS